MSVFVDVKSGSAKRKSTKKYITRYNPKYTEEYPWVSPSEKGDTFAYCQLCKVDISIRSVGAKGLRDHEATCRHFQSMQQYEMNNGAPLKKFTDNSVEKILDSNPGKREGFELTQEEDEISATSVPNWISHHFQHSIFSTSNIGNPIQQQIPPLPVPLSPNATAASTNYSEGITITVCPLIEERESNETEPSSDNATKATASDEDPVHQETDNAAKGTASDGESVHRETEKMSPAVSGEEVDKTKTKISATDASDNTSMPLTTEDLTCDICGVLFNSWRDLKKDLLLHVKEALNTNSRKETFMERSLSVAKETEEVAAKFGSVRRRGRPAGSKNKKVKNDNVLELPSSQLSKEQEDSPERHLQQNQSPTSGEETTLELHKTKTILKTHSPPAVFIEEKDDGDGRSEHRENNPTEEDANECPIEKKKKGENRPVKCSGQLHCRVCKASFYSRPELREHFNEAHNEGRPYQCELCFRFFTTKNNLEVHKRHKHTELEQEPCKCETCGKILSSPTNLRIHMKIHKGEKPFECPICKKLFSRKANMEMHTVYHTREKRFTCEVCGQSFYAINALKRHTKLHTGERDYACDICGATYVTGTDLRRHLLKHEDVKPFPCHLCEKQFTRSHDLKTHLRYHNKDLRFKCSVCGRQFVESGNFRRHMRRHTGERPYACHICPQKFTQVHHYKVHMKTSHSDEIDNDIPEINSSTKRFIYRDPCHIQRHSNSTRPSSVERQFESHLSEPSVHFNIVPNDFSSSDTIVNLSAVHDSNTSQHSLNDKNSPDSTSSNVNRQYNSYMYNSTNATQYQPHIVSEICDATSSNASEVP